MKKIVVVVVVLVLLVLGYFGYRYMSVTREVNTTQPAAEAKDGLRDAIFTADQPPTDKIVVPYAMLAKGGYVVLHKEEGGAPGEIVAQSPYLPSGEHWFLTFSLTQKAATGDVFFAMLHADNGDKTFELQKDLPIGLEKNQVIMMRFKIDPKAVLPTAPTPTR